MKNILKTAFLKTLPVMAGYLVLGFGFGMIAHTNGYGFFWVFAMSLFIYAGSMQYVAINLLTSGASLIAAFLTTLTVNARHLFYGISMIEPYKEAGKYKPFLIFGLTDETYSLVCTGEHPKGSNFHQYSFVVTLFNHVYWITGSLLGVLLSSLISIDTNGVEFAMTALFLTVFVEQWLSTKNHLPALTGVVVSLICLLIFGPDNFLIPAILLISLVLFAGRKWMVDEKTNTEVVCQEEASKKEVAHRE